ncbi:unnamed protein product [Ostreobium quekettii]|uniref:SprT-like domain-containing protein n=1 Tax=Ostreobium quekettii TaxID=121088 RepID=A0A8S1IPN9_9CHLO|nr:unnamed protein product [Ostreobium quekettii]
MSFCLRRCAGQCSYHTHGGCRVVLSEPLLKYRPTKDLKETLLHEMIHSYIFLQRIKDDGGHGTKFRELMNFINTATFPDSQRPPSGYNVTVYHGFHGEVAQYRTHWWECEKCGNTVKRATNRPPQEADCRRRKIVDKQCQDPYCAYHMHIKYCGGQYKKTKEPEGYGRKRQRPRDNSCDNVGDHSKKQKQKATSTPITKYFGKMQDTAAAGSLDAEEKPAGAFSGKAYFLGAEPGSGLPRPRLPGLQNPAAQPASSTPFIPLPSPHSQQGPGKSKAQQIHGRPVGSVFSGDAGNAHYLGQAPVAYWPVVSSKGSSSDSPGVTPCRQGPHDVEPAKVTEGPTPVVVDLVSCTGGSSCARDSRFQEQGCGGDPEDLREPSWSTKDGKAKGYVDSGKGRAFLSKDPSPTHSSAGCGATVDVIDLSMDNDMDIDEEVTLTMAPGAEGDRVVCPGCGREWALACTTNEALAEHMDMCLSA